MTDWITDSADEQSVEELLRDADQIRVPVFQRSYVWRKPQFDQLCDDIRVIRDGIEKSQFLGAIVAYEEPRPSSVVGRLKVLAVVDGQQRLLTLYLFVMAIAEQLASIDAEIAAEVVQEFLLLPRRRGLEMNTRLVPGFKDQAQFRALWNRLHTNEALRRVFKGNPPKPPVASGDEEGDLVSQYSRIDRYIRTEVPSDGSERIEFLRELLSLVTRQLTFVHLRLTEPSTATKIFERLNFRGVRVGIVDLVRNEVFSRLSHDPAAAIRLFHEVWSPFEESFEAEAEAFFFPYCLIHNSNIKKSQLFTELRSIWSGLEPQEIIDHMLPYQPPFMATATGRQISDDIEVNDRVDRLYRLGIPTVVYAFLMKVLYEQTEGRLDPTTCVEVMDVVESFLTRRAIAGFEPTGLHAIFKGLWGEMASEPSVVSFTKAVRRRPTIQWPSDAEVQEAVLQRPLGRSKICRYLLVEMDRAMPGDNPTETPTIEHVLPQSYDSSSSWAELFSAEEHRLSKDLWANVIPLSEPLNESLQASAYESKHPRYREESMFVTPRRVADEWSSWNKEALQERGEQLGAWAVQRWPHSGVLSENDQA